MKNLSTINNLSISGNVLIVLPKFIGDVVNCTPTIGILKNLYPQKQIYVLARPHLVDILARDETIHVISDERFNKNQPTSLLGQAKKLKEKNIGLAIILRNSLSEALLCYAACIKFRVGYAQNGRSPLLTHKFKLNKNHHYIYRYCRLVNESHGEPFSQFPNTNLHYKKSNLIIKKSERKNIGIYFGGTNKGHRHYPVDLAIDALQKINAEYKSCHFYLVGDPTEKKDSELLTSQLQQDTIHITNLVGKTSLIEMIDVIASLDLLISIDSGPMHIAAAVNVPFIAVVGLGTSPWSTVAPKQKNYIALVANGQQLKESEFIRDIKPEQISHAVTQLI
ncbi:heptosyltransferase-2 [Pseudoalteromonas sp. MBR-15]|jgi:heptosyltransferase-2